MSSINSNNSTTNLVSGERASSAGATADDPSQLGGAANNVLMQIKGEGESLKALMLSITKDREIIGGLREELAARQKEKSEAGSALQSAKNDVDADGEAKNPELISSLESQVSELACEIDGLREQIESVQGEIATKMEEAKQREDKLGELVGRELPAAQAKDKKRADDVAKAEGERMAGNPDGVQEASEDPAVKAAIKRATESKALRQSIHQENRGVDSFMPNTANAADRVNGGAGVQASGLTVE